MAVIENDPSARMQLRTRGELVHPGQCAVCGSGNCDEGYLDLGVYFDYEGTLYLCFNCCTQAGETIGMFTPQQVGSQQALIETLSKQNDEFRKELDRVRPIVTAIEHAYRTVIGSDSVPDLSSSDDSPEDDGSTPTESDTSESESDESVTGSEDGESEPKEPIKGSDDSGSNGPTKRDFKF